MLAVAIIKLDFDLILPNEPTHVPVSDGIDSPGATATLIKGIRAPHMRVLAASAERFRADQIEAYNHLEIVFQKADFDRSELSPRDPSNAKVEHAANNFLNRLAYFTGAPGIAPLLLENCAWKLDYLNDDRSELQPTDGKIRGHETMSISAGTTVLGGGKFWADFSKLPCQFVVPAWHPLLVQAERAVPEIGNALLLAAISLEVFVELSISDYARTTSIPTELWDWIANRNGGKGPSTVDQYSVLLQVVSGHNLKELPLLWTALRKIIEARNSFAHTGQALISNNPVAESEAQKLIKLSREIIEKVSFWLSTRS